MNIQFVSDGKGKAVAVQLAIEDWEKIKAVYPDVVSVSNELPDWQKKILDKRMASLEANPELILDGEDLFDGI